jgi:SAM-dependent methyltransferase
VRPQGKVGRPFYTSFAWAYDLLIEGTVSSRTEFILSALARRGVRAGASVLDAGCGTGNYSLALARRGFVVMGLDASEPLLDQARAKCAGLSMGLTFRVGDILALPREQAFDSILCRGVLNDLTDDASRRDVFFSFARALREGGVLILDVRNWPTTESRTRAEPVFEKSIQTARGLLTFRSVKTLDPDTRCLRITEEHRLQGPDGVAAETYDSVMRCWTEDELRKCLSAAGFASIEVLGDYDFFCPVGSTDRIVALASRVSNPDPKTRPRPPFPS